jgi:polysaccharide deacetylase
VKAAVVAVLITGCHNPDWLEDDGTKRVLCSTSIDDLSQSSPVELADSELERAAVSGEVALLHTHRPGVTISRPMLDHVLDHADALGLDYLTYAELGHVTRPGLALCFDDDHVDEWMTVRDVLRAHHARVTFFVTRYTQLADTARAQLHELAGDGHGVEAHSVSHQNAKKFVAANGLDAYLDQEAIPSIEILEDDGYPVTSYAFPFGASTAELDAALLEHVARVRVSSGSCPY